MLENKPQNSMLEITVISAQGIKNTSCSLFPTFSRRLKPFVTITACPPPPPSSSKAENNCNVYTSRVDDEGGLNPTWGDKFLIPLESTFFTSSYSCVYIQLYTKRALLGRALLSWIQIPVSDILDGLLPLESVHHLSYRLRKRDGSRGHGIVNVSCRFVGQVPFVNIVPGDNRHLAAVETWSTVTGIPVTAWHAKCGRDNMDNRIRTRNTNVICQGPQGGRNKEQRNDRMDKDVHYNYVSWNQSIGVEFC